MDENSQVLNSELNRDFVPKAISELLTEVGAADDVSKKLSKLNGYLHLLVEEMKKIEALKLELPLCMLLLKDAIERLKKEAMQYCKGKVIGPSIDSDSDDDREANLRSDCCENKNWMSTAQFWNNDVRYENCDINKPESRGKEESGSGIDRLFQLSNFTNKGRLFEGQSGVVSAPPPPPPMKQHLPFDGLSLSIEVGSFDLNLTGSSNGRSTLVDQLRNKAQKQEQKKSRRCWSPELHRRFVNALQRLGGAQAAKPKQIRELMQVDGLTNDEVKSHLQKYRLHIQKGQHLQLPPHQMA